MGNAAGCVLSGVVISGVSFSSTLGSTRSLNFTRGGPTTSIRNRSTYHGIYVLTTLSFKGRVCPRRMGAGNVARVALSSIRGTSDFNTIVGLVNRTGGVRGNAIITSIDPALIKHSRLLSDIGNMFGTVVVGNSRANRITFCNGNTNGRTATDTIITSVLSYVGGYSGRGCLY